MKRSIILSAVLLTATMTFGQQSETVTTPATAETITLDDTFHPQIKVTVPDQQNTIDPVLDKNVGDGEIPKVLLDLPSEVKTFEHDLKVFPNPNHGLFKIQLPETDQAIKAIEIFDLTGKIRYADKQFLLDVPLEKDIDITGLENGAYILRIVLEEDVLIERVVKRD